MVKRNPKIAIDISPTQNANSQRGVGFYTQHLIDSLQHEIKTNPAYKHWQIDFITNSKLRVNDYDLIHYPYFDPFFLTLPSSSKIPFIVTVHDLIPRQFKKFYPVGIKGEIKWLIQKHRLKKAAYIITDSHSSKYTIHDLTGYPADHIYPIYLAADKSFKPIGDKNRLLMIKNKYHLPDKFVLYIGDINWNKNIPRLVSVCFDLKYPLVIVGSAATRRNVEDHPWNKDLLWLQKQKSSFLTLTGFVPEADLPSIYNLATMYCQPSHQEGFGLTLVEAMQSGLPVAYSLNSSLQEIMDYNGGFFDSHSPVQIKKSLKNLWCNPSLRLKFRKLGLKRAQIFDWQYTALQTLSVYNLAINHGH